MHFINNPDPNQEFMLKPDPNQDPTFFSLGSTTLITCHAIATETLEDLL